MKKTYTIKFNFETIEEMQDFISEKKLNKNKKLDAIQKLPVIKCSECSRKLEGSYGEAVKKYSVENYGKVLCQDCQKKFKKLSKETE